MALLKEAQEWQTNTRLKVNKKRRLGKTDIELPEIGYGADDLFGDHVFGKKGITEDVAYEVITTAIQHGMTFFDTGVNYGYAEKGLEGVYLKQYKKASLHVQS